MNSFYKRNELEQIGFKNVGSNVLISKNASLYGAENISIGNNVRIDDFCILSGKIEIGSFIHISAYTGLFAGNAGIIINDFVTISSRCAIYAISDDYSGEYMANPMVPDAYRKVESIEVIFEKYSIVGTGTTILPGSIIGEGTAVGCMSLVKDKLTSYGIFAGVPCKRIGDRKKDFLKYKEYLIEE